MIVFGSIVAYLIVGLFIGRSAYVDTYKDYLEEMEAWERKQGRYGYRSEFDKPWNPAALAGVLVALFWPLFVVWGLLSLFFTAPIRKEEHEAEKRAEQLKFWSKREQDTSISVAERETASQVLRALRGE